MSQNKHLMHGWFCPRASLIGLLFKATLAISLSLEAPKGSSMQPVSMWECKQVPDVHHQTDTNERDSLVQVTKVVTMANKLKLQITTKTVYPWWFFYIIPLSRWRHSLQIDFSLFCQKPFPGFTGGRFTMGSTRISSAKFRGCNKFGLLLCLLMFTDM